MGRPKEHGEDTREALLEAAERLLADEGPGAVTVRRVADEVGTSTRAIYSVFGGKEGLYSALFRKAADTFRRLAEAVPRQSDPVDELIPLGLSYRQSALAEPNLYGLLFDRAVPDFVPTGEDLQFARRSQERVLDTVRRCADAGVLPASDAEATFNALWGVVHGLASLELIGCFGPPEAAEVVWRSALPTFVRGLTLPHDEP